MTDANDDAFALYDAVIQKRIDNKVCMYCTESLGLDAVEMNGFKYCGVGCAHVATEQEGE